MTAPDLKASIQVWFQPQGIGRCKKCGVAITWRITRRRGRSVSFTGNPPVLHHFDSVEGPRVDVLDASLLHFKTCSGPRTKRRSRRQPKPIVLKKRDPQMSFIHLGGLHP